MHKAIQTYPWAVALLGAVLMVIGYSQTWGQSTNGTGSQMFFDLITIAGWVLLIGGVVILVKSRKVK